MRKSKAKNDRVQKITDLWRDIIVKKADKEDIFNLKEVINSLIPTEVISIVESIIEDSNDTLIAK